MKAGADYSVVFTTAATLACALGCFSADPRSVDGALDYASRALEERDTGRLFRILDQQSRHALDATHKSRQDAARIIRANYPADQIPTALAELGDAALAPTTQDLFVKRCDSKCIEWFEDHVAAAAEQHEDRGLTIIRTVRDTTLQLRRGTDSWYGIVWKTAELSAERDRAARDLAQIQENARVYGLRKRLESNR
jgi:hypothetical protein